MSQVPRSHKGFIENTVIKKLEVKAGVSDAQQKGLWMRKRVSPA